MSIWEKTTTLSESVTTERIERTEHLGEGIEPVRVRVGAQPDLLGSRNGEQYHNALISGYTVLLPSQRNKHDSPPEEGEVSESGQNGSFAISAIDKRSKSSQDYQNCTGLIVSGRVKESGEQVSFLTHQDPTFVLDEGKGVFEESLRQRLTEMKEMCDEGTIDAVIVGGKLLGNEQSHKDYEESITMVSDIVNTELEFQPYIATGPKLGASAKGEDVTHHTSSKQLFIARSASVMKESQNTGFFPRDLPKNWSY